MMNSSKKAQFAEMVSNVLYNKSVSPDTARNVKDWAIYVNEAAYIDFETAARVLYKICGIVY